MSKRRASTAAATCPGCTADFDPEIHIPLVGSCGDSICAVCMDEKKIEACPVCSEENAFASKKKNKLALELLSIVTEINLNEPKRAKLEEEEDNLDVEAPEEPVPPIMNPKYRHFLYQIVNRLNPTSFINLSSTCKYLYDYCFYSEDVEVTHRINEMFIDEHSDELRFSLSGETDDDFRDGLERRYLPFSHSGCKDEILSSALGRKMLKKKHIVYRLEELEIESALIHRNDFFPSLRSFLAEFPIVKIVLVSLRLFWHTADECSLFLKFLKDFHVESIEITEHAEDEDDVDKEKVKSTYALLLKNLKSFESGGKLDERLILNVSVPKLRLENTTISKATFLELIPKLATFTGKIDWSIGCQSFDFDYETLSSFNVVMFDYERSVPEERPLVFIKEGDPDVCWLLRNDGKVLKCRQDAYSNMEISMCPLKRYPRSLRSNASASESSDSESSDSESSNLDLPDSEKSDSELSDSEASDPRSFGSEPSGSGSSDLDLLDSASSDPDW